VRLELAASELRPTQVPPVMEKSAALVPPMAPVLEILMVEAA
jgi:hypothetical protein